MKASNKNSITKLSKAAVIVLSAICIIIAASLFIKTQYMQKMSEKFNVKYNDKNNDKYNDKGAGQPTDKSYGETDDKAPKPLELSKQPETQAQEPIKEIQGLVAVESIDKTIVIDLRYATTNNFTHKKVYPVNVCVLKKSTALKLKAVNEELKKKGYGIKIYDGYRPLKAQEIFWSIVPDPRYVEDPKKGGSRHNTGTAVDITLVDDKGYEIEMPSGFDDFTDRAWRTSNTMSTKARENMKLLTNAMTAHGFKTIQTEWWHFEDGEGADCSILDVAFEEFLK